MNESDKNQRILITGATGFIGSYIARTLLSIGYQNIIATCRQTSRFELLGGAKEDIQWIETDANDFSDIDHITQSCRAVIHCAGLVSMNRYAWKSLVNTNIRGTANIVNWCLDTGVDRLVFISSTTALGKTRQGKIIDEKAVWQEAPLDSIYAKSKYLAELEVFRGQAEGLSTVVVNPPFVLGAGWWDKGPLSMIGEVDGGLSFYPSGTNGVVDVRDLARLVALLTTQKVNGDRFICSVENLSHQQLSLDLAAALGRKPPTKPIGPLIAGTIGILDPFLGLFYKNTPVTSQGLYLANQDFRYDHSKSIEINGFSYRQVSETIKTTSESYKNSKKLGNNFGILPI